MAKRSAYTSKSTKSKRPALITKFLSCRSVVRDCGKENFHSPGADTTPLIRRTESSWRGARNPAPVSKPINGGSRADRQSGKTHDLTEKFDRLMAVSRGYLTRRQFVSQRRTMAKHHLFFTLGSDPAGRDRPHARRRSYVRSEWRSLLHATSIGAPNEIWRLVFTDPALLNWAQSLGDGLMTKHDLPISVTHLNDAALSQIDVQPLGVHGKGANGRGPGGGHGQAAGIRSK